MLHNYWLIEIGVFWENKHYLEYGKPTAVLGDIARIMVDKGQVDQALELQNERLEVNKELQDVDGIAAAYWEIAQIELQNNKHTQALEHLSKSYGLFLKIGRLDGICIIGNTLGQLLCAFGKTEEGIPILKRSKDGFLQLGMIGQAEAVQKMIDSLDG